MLAYNRTLSLTYYSDSGMGGTEVESHNFMTPDLLNIFKINF